MKDVSEYIEYGFKIIGGLITVGGSIFALGKVTGRWQVKERVNVQEVAQLGVELGLCKTSIDELKATVRDLQEDKKLSTQKVKTIEGSITQIMREVDKQGDKLEDFFNKMYELKR